MMTGRLFSYHIFWKEYRQMRGFWLSVLAMTVVMQLIVFAVSFGSRTLEPVYGLSICFAALYALGSGATMFALEHENETYEFLRSLPTRALPTFFGKVAFTVVSAPLLLAATLGFAALLCAFADEPVRVEWGLLLAWSIGSLVLFLWATLFSLFMHHAVRAALFGGVAAALSMAAVSGLLQGLSVSGIESLAIALAGIVTLVAAVDVWLGTRWYREATTRSSADDLERRREEFAKSFGAYEIETVASKGSMFAHLLWLQWRQSRGMIFGLTVLAAWFTLALIWIGTFDGSVHRAVRGSGWQYLYNVASVFFGCGYLAGWFVIPAAGASVFAGDQKRSQFRFLADRGLSPKLVWWSRHPVWIAAVAVWLAFALAPLLIIGASLPPRSDLPGFFFWYVFPALLCIPLAYSFGQLCSMLFRSGILCVAVAIVGSVLLAMWAFGMSFLRVPLIWSVAPLPVILLVATRIRTRGWLIESNTFRSWLPVVAVLLVPMAAILSGVGLYRAYSLPWVEPGFDVAAFTAPASAEAKETAKMYGRAADMLIAGVGESDHGNTEEPNLDQASEDPVALILEASRRGDCDDLTKYLPAMKHIGCVQDMADSVLQAGKQLENGGDLKGAAEHYLAVLRMANQTYPHSETPLVVANIEAKALSRLSRWSTAREQSSERIVNAIRAIENLTGQPATMDTAIKAKYVRFMETIDGDLDDMFEWSGPDFRNVGPALMLYWTPWERERARRMLRLVISNELEAYRKMYSDLANDRQVTLRGYGIPEERADHTRRQMTPDGWLSSLSFAGQIDQLAMTELTRRATLIAMALAAWQLDHESLPDRLEELKGEYLTRIPVDPFSGELFRYYWKGVDEPVVRFGKYTGEETIVIEAKKPFFWSQGPFVTTTPGGSGPNGFEIQRDHEKRRAASWQEVWAAGRIFPVPQPR